MELAEVGVARTGYVERDGTPQQALMNPEETARIEMHEPFVEGLADLEEFDFIWILSWLGDDAQGRPLSEIPHMLAHLGRTIGTFSNRGPFRPSPIGLHLVELVKVDGADVVFRGVDLVDGTPVLDIKPYVSRFDDPGQETRSGWYELARLDEVAKNQGRLI